MGCKEVRYRGIYGGDEEIGSGEGVVGREVVWEVR